MTDIAPAFIRSLITDVLVAREHLAENDDQSRRRNLIRANFAAIEGNAWLLRMDVLEAGKSLYQLSPLDVLALRDIGYSVGDQGVLKETPQYMPLKTAIKYSFRKAREISPAIAVDYSDAGWAAMLDSIKVRHRVTHPKSADDLVITNEEIASSSAALIWLLAAVEQALDSMNIARREHNIKARALLAELKRGDPEALRIYNALLMRDDDI